jgi:hypothetical protein
MYIEYRDAAYEEFLLIKIDGCEELSLFIYDHPSFFNYDNEPERRRRKK